MENTKIQYKVTDFVMMAYVIAIISELSNWTWLMHIAIAIAVICLVLSMMLLIQKSKWPAQHRKRFIWRSVYLFVFSVTIICYSFLRIY